MGIDLDGWSRSVSISKKERETVKKKSLLDIIRLRKKFGIFQCRLQVCNSLIDGILHPNSWLFHVFHQKLFSFFR